MPDESGRPATKADVSLLKTDVSLLKTDVSLLKTELKADVSHLRDELKGDISSLRDELKGDVSNLRDELKGDISNLRTELKTDISSLRTELKTDISNLGTELRAEFATKSELREGIAHLDQKISRVAAALVNTQADVRRIEQTMATKKDVERILGAIDAFAKKSDNYDKAVTIHGPILTEVQASLKDHEGRLQVLESARS